MNLTQLFEYLLRRVDLDGQVNLNPDEVARVRELMAEAERVAT